MTDDLQYQWINTQLGWGDQHWFIELKEFQKEAKLKLRVGCQGLEIIIDKETLKSMSRAFDILSKKEKV
jgi:hypothetical protein